MSGQPAAGVPADRPTARAGPAGRVGQTWRVRHAGRAGPAGRAGRVGGAAPVAHAVEGVGGLVRLALRRDRILGPIWAGGLGLLPAFYLAAIRITYPDAAARRGLFAGITGSAVERISIGRAYSATLGGLTAWRAGLTPVLAGLAGLLIVIRHTRAEEEGGRLELLRGLPVSRLAPLAAALVLGAGSQVFLGLVAAVSLIVVGLGTAGSVALGAAAAAAGLVYTAVGALAAQLTAGARTARGLGLAVLGVAFVLRSAGDVGGRYTTAAMWVSPFGWSEQVRPFAGDRWPVLLLPLALTLGCGAAAVAVAARRDLGSGLLHGRLARAAAPGWLRGPLTLRWRLSRAVFGAWAVGCGLIGALGGAAVPAAVDQLRVSAGMRAALTHLGGTGDLTDALLSAIAGLLGLLATAYSVASIGSARAEETAGLVEPVLAARGSRYRWAASVLGWAALAPVVLLGIAGLALGCAAALTGAAGPDAVGRALAAALVQVPAVWCTAGVAALAFGLLPRAVAAGWAALGAVILLDQVGELLHLPRGVRALSPFGHLPHLPGGPVSAVPLVVLVAVAAGFGLIAAAGLRRRAVG